jgi:cobalamin transport system substrate-binding protein
MPRRALSRLVVGALAIALGVAGRAPATSGAALTVHDMRGREVTLAAPPRRIVSLVPSVTEVIFALGAENRLAGVTDYCDYPPAARTRPSVGGMVNPSLEVLAALRPDLVFATDEGNREETIAQVQRLGIPVYLVHASRVAAVLEVITRVGDLVERRTEAAALAAGLEARITAIGARVARHRPPRVLYVLWPDPLIVPGRDSLLTELIERAGGRSVTGAEGDAYPRFSLEAAVARAPEVIILADHGSGSSAGRAAPETWRRLTSVPAIRNGRLYSADLSVLHRYGPRIGDGVEQLARMIHPEAFR